MIVSLIVYHIVFTGILLILVMASGYGQHAASLSVGAAVSGANLVILVWSWQRIFLKKSIALAVSAIVFKYAILGVIIYFVLTRVQINALAFVVGLSTMIPTTLAFAYKTNGREQLETKA